MLFEITIKMFAQIVGMPNVKIRESFSQPPGEDMKTTKTIVYNGSLYTLTFHEYNYQEYGHRATRQRIEDGQICDESLHYYCQIIDGDARVFARCLRGQVAWVGNGWSWLLVDRAEHHIKTEGISPILAYRKARQ